MSVWESRIREHRIWSLLELLGPAIDQAFGRENLARESAEALARLKVALAFCGKRIGSTDPLLINPGTLNAIADALSNMKAQVDAFISDGNHVQLDSANANADALLAQLGSMPSLTTSEDLIALMAATSSYRSTVDDAARTWSESTRKAKADLTGLDVKLKEFVAESQVNFADLKSQIEGERQKLLTVVGEQQKAFSEAQETRSNTYSKTLSDQQGQFSTAQEARGTQFTTVLGDYTKRLADQDAEFTKERNTFSLNVEKRISELDTEYRGNADKLIDAVKQRRGEVEKLVGVIGTLGVTSGYQKTADKDQISMWIWQGVTVAALLGLIRFAFTAFLPSVQGDFKWSSFAGRIFLTVTVGVLAAYAGTQADRFFHTERKNRKLALELAAIDPFIALFPEDEQQKFKLEIGRRSFAQDDKPGTDVFSKSPATALAVILGSKEGQQAIQMLQSFAESAAKLPK